jgi:DNA-binding response OmpR family regulator
VARILIVEDEERIASFVAKGLSADGHRTTVVGDGRSGLDHALSGEFDLMVLDIGLPGLDGYQVARCLREELHLDHALLVAMTGYGQPEDRRRSREAGIQYHFVKPVEPLVLRNLLARVAVPEEWREGRPS